MSFITLTESAGKKVVCVFVHAIVSFMDGAVRTIDGGLILCDETMAEIKDKLRHI